MIPVPRAIRTWASSLPVHCRSWLSCLAMSESAPLTPKRMTVRFFMDDAFASLRSGINDKSASSGSSAWATSACRWPGPSPTAASRSSASTSTRPRSSRLRRGESYIGHIPDEVVRAMRGQRLRGDRPTSTASTSPTPSSSACPRR